MIKVLETVKDYVSFMAELTINDGEILCTSYLPSALFPKDTLSLYYQRVNVTPKYSNITDKLWFYGKNLLQAALEGTATICIEVEAIHNFCSEGKVHEANPVFEVGYAIRGAVLGKLLDLSRNGSLVIVKGPLPYIFRLHPPSGILLDVRRNVTEQKVQGIWIENQKAYNSFKKEFFRLKSEVMNKNKTELLSSEIQTAIEHFDEGESYKWSWL